ncbi:alpha/beta hydrolase [Aspergillus clavatus NRRL 1]|uniref:Dihydrofolate reductase n=1 Tax=Aspergillus clavatus (strain ATCC 1007 / CBS 513.65 / DSM 816 / NCTC 3887 / NRRL 1 / QM 1276 / 107) TaxID=344612 RepID=A1CJD1_ASPCL|nr:dihydrofolate reductase [Aspergillus clavatus NRRL 1]EAW09255.1 dihydrofolate reductase [Aspergillus clavatus NRRL 1]
MAPRQPLKLLMLHGYTQSGPLFYAKSRALIKHLTKAFPLHDVSASYPTGPARLNPADIPGYEPPAERSPADQQQEDEKIEAYGWYRRSDAAESPLYVGLEDGLAAIAKVLRDEGPFDGVIGFSQGAAMAAMVASLLEPGRKEAFAHFADPEVASHGAGLKQPVASIPYPASFAQIVHPPLKFAVCYSGFRSPGPRYRSFYENPPIQTPVLHVLGSLDAVVDDTRSRALIEACAGNPEEEGKVVWHPGGHFLPSQRPYLDAAVMFIRGQLEGNKAKADAKEEDAWEMDVPF